MDQYVSFLICNTYLHIHGSLTFVRVIRIISIAKTVVWIIFILETAIPRAVGVIYVCSRAEAMVGVPLICDTTTARIACVINCQTVAEALSYIQERYFGIYDHLQFSPIFSNFLQFLKTGYFP